MKAIKRLWYRLSQLTISNNKRQKDDLNGKLITVMKVTNTTKKTTILKMRALAKMTKLRSLAITRIKAMLREKFYK